MRRLWSLAVVAMLGVAVWLVFGWSAGSSKNPQFVTTPVDRGPLSATVSATGTVNPVTTVTVGTYVSGPIQAIYADYNTPVKKDQLLAKIDPRPFQVKVDDARAALANARARLEKDRADAKFKAVSVARSRKLGASGILSTSDLDLAVSQDSQARAQVTLDQADIESAEAKLHAAEVDLAYTDITSPVEGVVVSRSVSVGQTVAATFQTPTLFLVAGDLAKMLVVASVSESDIGGIDRDQDVSFTVDAYPTDTFRGRVSQVRNAPITVLNVVTYEVLVSVKNDDLRLKPGMTANVTITTAKREDALRVPTAALRFRPPAVGEEGGAAAADGAAPRGPRVWTLDERGRPHPVGISTGVADDRFTEVTSGLAPGDLVITGIHREASAAPTAPGSAPSFGPARRMR
jgi:HlyD family secretion protein